MFRKGCLKSPAPSPSLDGAQKRKCVVFCPDGEDEVHIADEWDRTPSEPVPKLSYQEMLEFNAIQRSLPHANQPPDPFTGKPGRQYLSTVPVGLLPLLPETASNPMTAASPSSVASPTTPCSSAEHFRLPRSVGSASLPPIPNTQNWPPAGLAQLPNRSGPPPRVKSKFSFLPLLDTPPNSAATTPASSAPESRSLSPVISSSTDTTPSLTNNSLSSNNSPASSPQLAHQKTMDTDSSLPPAVKALRLEAVPSPNLVPPSPLTLNRSTPTSYFKTLHSPTSAPAPVDVLATSKPLTRKKKTVIVVNDVEIEVDEDEDEPEPPTFVINTSCGTLDEPEPPTVLGTAAISISRPILPSSSSSQLSSSVSSTSTISSSVYSHSTSMSSFNNFDSEFEGSEHCQTLHSPLASPISSVSGGSPLCSPSSSPMTLSPIKAAAISATSAFRRPCSPIKYSGVRMRGGNPSSPVLVPSA